MAIGSQTGKRRDGQRQALGIQTGKGPVDPSRSSGAVHVQQPGGEHPGNTDIALKSFSVALQKIATADAAFSRAAIEASKATKPSRHTRFVYDPVKGHE